MSAASPIAKPSSKQEIGEPERKLLYYPQPQLAKVMEQLGIPVSHCGFCGEPYIKSVHGVGSKYCTIECSNKMRNKRKRERYAKSAMTKLEREIKQGEKSNRNSDKFYEIGDPERKLAMPDGAEHGSAKAALRTNCGCPKCLRRRQNMRKRGLL